MRTVLYTQEQLHGASHVDGVFFQCSMCLYIKPVQTTGGTGYGCEHGKPVCYACCGVQDRGRLVRDGKGVMYLTSDADGWSVSNWPGTFKVRCAEPKHFNHPFTRQAVISYFRYAGAMWSAKNIGDSQIAHVRRLKR